MANQYTMYVLRKDMRYMTGKLHNGVPVFDSRDQAMELTVDEIETEVRNHPMLAECERIEVED